MPASVQISLTGVQIDFFREIGAKPIRFRTRIYQIPVLQRHRLTKKAFGQANRCAMGPGSGICLIVQIRGKGRDLPPPPPF